MGQLTRIGIRNTPQRVGQAASRARCANDEMLVAWAIPSGSKACSRLVHTDLGRLLAYRSSRGRKFSDHK
jgi:hypothetical protein